MKAGATVSLDNGKVMMVAWKDKSVVTSLAAITWRLKKGLGETEEIMKPLCVTECNLFMSRVDRLDQMISYYLFMKKMCKWPNKVFNYLLEVNLWNSFVLHKEKK